MFPFTYKKDFSFKINDLENIDMDYLFDSFTFQFDNPKRNGNKIFFDNFNTAFKRHQWLDSGELIIVKSNETLTIKLELNFFIFSFMIMVVSLVVLFAGDKPLVLGLLGFTILWLFYLLLYILTGSMFVASIKRTVEKLRQIDRKLIELKGKEITKR